MDAREGEQIWHIDKIKIMLAIVSSKFTCSIVQYPFQQQDLCIKIYLQVVTPPSQRIRQLLYIQVNYFCCIC